MSERDNPFEVALENKEFVIGLIAGGIIGGLVGSGIGSAVTRSKINQMDLVDKVAAKSPAIKIVIKNILDLLNEEVRPVKASHISKEDVIELVTAGLELWKKLKK